MALALGLENKRQVIIASVLFGVLVISAFVVYRMFSGPSSPPDSGPAPAAPQLRDAPTANNTAPAAGAAAPAAGAAAPAAGNEAQRLTNAGIDPALHFDKLAQSENVEYSGTGRNIFSAESEPPPLPKAIAPPRPNGPAAVAQNTPPPPPKPPAIDLRYFGYSEDNHKVLKAFFMHGDDIFMARSGDIVDHRYRVGAIHPTNVEITDLSYNNTQTLQLAQF
jgi:hypothetical protein